MARIRTIKPEFWTDPFMVQLEPIGRLVFLALLTCADDHGFIEDEPERIAMEVMPKEDELVIDDWIQFFVASGKLEFYVDDDEKTFIKIKNWEKHQRVDRPSQSKIYREGSRKLAIPLSTRRAVAEKYGCKPGGDVSAACYYCGGKGRVHWHKLGNGKPSSWVTFPGLELDHLECEADGGGNTHENIVLACRMCNRSKGTKAWVEVICRVNNAANLEELAEAREGSRVFPVGKERKGSGKEGNGDMSGKPDVPPLKETAKEVLNFLNHKTGRNYQQVDANLDLIIARLKEGFTVSQLRQVVAKKTREWKGDDKMDEYLRPATLFNKTKFAQYSGELVEVKPDEQVLS